jgi:hypothetical protein
MPNATFVASELAQDKVHQHFKVCFARIELGVLPFEFGNALGPTIGDFFPRECSGTVRRGNELKFLQGFLAD